MTTDFTEVTPLLAQAVVDMGLLHDIIHGGDTDTVVTDGGTVDSVAKAVAAISAFSAPVHDSFTGDGVETDWTLSSTPASTAALLVFVDDAPTRGFTLSGNTLTIAPAVGDTLVIETVDLSSSAAFDAGDLAAIAAIAANITTVAGISANVTTVAGDATDIGTVATDLAGSDTIGTVAAAIASIVAVQAALTNIGTVATDLAGSDTVGTVATDLAGDNDIGAVAAATASISAVEAALTDIGTVATDLGGDDDIGTVAGAISNLNALAAIIADISTVAGVSANVTTVASNIAAVNAAVSAAARQGFRNRFGKMPPAMLGLDLGDTSLLTLSRATVGFTGTDGGGIESKAIDAVRITHDPETGEPLGLLVEPAGTNLILNSGDQSGWPLGANLSRATGQADPAGGTAATRITATSAGTSTANYLRTGTVSGSYTDGIASIWVRRVTGTGTVRLLALNNATGAGTKDITADLTSRWKRFDNFGSPGGSFLYIGVGILTSGDAVDVAFGQVEADQGDTLPTSYIATTDSTVTRAADLATIDLSAVSAFRADGFSLIAEVVLGGDDGVILSVGETSTNEIALDLQAGTLKLTGADSLDVTAASGLAAGDRIVVALRVTTNDVAVSVGGATVVTEGTHTPNGGADEMQLGANIDGSDGLACVIGQVAIFGILPDASLEAMSNG